MAVEYHLSLPEPHSHLFRVELRIPAPPRPLLLRMPSWTPGSYLLREFPRNVQDFTAHDGSDLPVACRKVDKNSWSIEGDWSGPITVRYRVYANELSVRTSHLDASHGYVNGASVFMYVDGLEGEEARLRIDAPSGWRAATSLQETEDGWLNAPDYDTLVDSPIEIGPHRTIAWEQFGLPHRYVVWGAGAVDEQRLVSDTRRVIDECARMFGGVPYEGYLFILHVLPDGRGGLEHRSSSSLQVPPSWLAGDDYEKLIALVAHEFFHVWLGKRIRPEPLGPFDYVRENYTRNLWVVEGFTTYYTELLLVRSGVVTKERFLERIGASIAQYEALPGRRHQSLEDSSFDTWIRFYRPDAHTPNSQVSYYQKGMLVALALDLELRRRTGGARSLDDVMGLLWTRYGARDVGFPEEREAGIQAIVEEVGGGEMDDLFARYVAGTSEIDFDAHLEVLGLELGPASDARRGAGRPARPVPGTPAIHETRLGVRLREEMGRVKVSHVLTGTPAFRAGVNAGDEIVAVDGGRATIAEIGRVLAVAEAGTQVGMAVMRRDRLLTVAATLTERNEPRAAILPVADVRAEQEEMLAGWVAGRDIATPENGPA